MFVVVVVLLLVRFDERSGNVVDLIVIVVAGYTLHTQVHSSVVEVKFVVVIV